MDIKFYRCKHCGQIIVKVVDKGIPVVCCGEEMEELVANSVDAAKEKHIPVIEQNGKNVYVTVSTVLHPMQDVHYIEWIVLVTNKGIYKRFLKPGDMPKASFVIADDEIVESAYEHCNLHGLWQGK